MDSNQAVAFRIGPSNDREEVERLRAELARQEAELAKAREENEAMRGQLARHETLLTEAAVVWQCPRLGMPEKLLWWGLASTALEQRSSVICQQIGALGAHYAGSQRSGTRALEGEKESPRGSLKGEGLVVEHGRARNVVTLELRNPLTALRARIARRSDGQLFISFDADEEQPDLFEAGRTSSAERHENAQPGSGSVDGADVSGRQVGGFGTKTADSPNINIKHNPDPSGDINIQHEAHHVERSSGGFGAKTADSPKPPAREPTGMAVLVADTLAHLVDHLADDATRRQRATELAGQIVLAVNDPDFAHLEEFAATLAHAVCVDLDFPAPRLWPILKNLREGSTKKGGKIDNPGGWFRTAVRAQAAEIVRATLDRRGDVGDAIKELLVTRKAK